jgi:N4-gp56 family major capsid protein
MAITVYGDVSPRVGIIAVSQFLKYAEHAIVFNKLGQIERVPKNKGQTIKWRRFVPFEPITTALTEGVTPTSQKLAVQDVTASLLQYGGWAEITDVIQDTHEDPILQGATQIHGLQAAESFETLTYYTLRAGTSVVYANGSARNAVNTKVSLSKLRSAVRTLNKNKSRKKTSILAPSVNYKTQAIEASYIAVCHTDLEPDIRDLAGFVPVSQYGSRQPICPQEFGSVENVRFITTTIAAPFPDAGGLDGDAVLSTTGTNADVYPIIIFGEDAYGTVALKGKESAEILVRNPGKPEKGNELGQVGSVGWKGWHVATRLNEAWMVRLEVAATLL